MRRFLCILAVCVALSASATAVAKKASLKSPVERIPLNKLGVDLELVCLKRDSDPTGPAITSFFVHHVEGEEPSKRSVTLEFYNNQLPPFFVMNDPVTRADHIRGTGSVSDSYILVGSGPANDLNGKRVSDKVSFRLVISFTPEGYLRGDLDVTSKEVSLARKGCSKAPARPPLTESKQ